MQTTPITATMPVITISDAIARLDDLLDAPGLSPAQAREADELIRMLAQTADMDACSDLFLPVLYAVGHVPPGIVPVDTREVAVFGRIYIAVSTTPN